MRRAFHSPLPPWKPLLDSLALSNRFLPSMASFEELSPQGKAGLSPPLLKMLCLC